MKAREDLPRSFVGTLGKEVVSLLCKTWASKIQSFTATHGAIFFSLRERFSGNKVTTKECKIENKERKTSWSFLILRVKQILGTIFWVMSDSNLSGLSWIPSLAIKHCQVHLSLPTSFPVTGLKGSDGTTSLNQASHHVPLTSRCSFRFLGRGSTHKAHPECPQKRAARRPEPKPCWFLAFGSFTLVLPLLWSESCDSAETFP